MISEKFTFPGALGSELAARLDRPSGAVRAYALFAHCFTCSKDIFAAARIAGALAEHGIAVLRFDFTGLGHSEGEFANTNFTSNIADLVAAADHLRARHAAPAILIGHSLGGAAVLAAAAQIAETRAVATIGAPFDPAHVSKHLAPAIAEIEAKGEAEVTLGARPFRIRKQFLDDIAGQRQRERIATLRKALIIFHGPRDDVVNVENAAQIFGAAKHPKSFVSLDDADHLLTRREDARYVAEIIAAWASRYIDAKPEIDMPSAEPGTVLVVETGQGALAQHVSVGGKFTMRADEPLAAGGTDTGPSPYDFLLAGLGACTSMTMRLYANRKGIPLKRASVTLSHGKIHAQDCGDCETKENKIDRIERIIALDGELSAEHRASLLAIAEKCPVHRTLHSEVSIMSRLAE